MLYSRKRLASGFCPGIQTLPLSPFNTGACMLYTTLVLWVLAGGRVGTETSLRSVEQILFCSDLEQFVGINTSCSCSCCGVQYRTWR